ncbi:hypothetical protein P8452_62818 [Trifolium repens]|nr:hypothetical protein P8452_50752 [Trifolium repens]WJX79727.1 hypothetical protein P8452_62818 [Trifolium repens]
MELRDRICESYMNDKAFCRSMRTIHVAGKRVTRVKNIGHITQIANKLIHLAHNQSHILVVFNGMSLHKSFFIVPCDSSIWWKRSERALQLVIKF